MSDAAKMIRTNRELLDYVNKLYQNGDQRIIAQCFDPKHRIIEQNKRYAWVYIIKEGITKCYMTDENAKEFIQEFLGEGTEFGELEVFSNNPSFCCVEAVTALSTFKISYRNFNELIDTDKKFNRIIISGMAAKISYKAPRHLYQHSYPIEANILKLKEVFPEFTQVISKKDIANYIGVTPRSLNRTLHSLKERNLL